MKHLLITLFFSGAIALSALAALDSGDSAPDFSARASLDGQEFNYSLAEARENGPVVVYFYPSAFTRGCNIQAHTFAVNMEKFTQAGASVVGVSLDSIDRLNEFSSDPAYCAGKLAVASDADGQIAAAYDLQVSAGREGMTDTRGEAIDHGFAERTTFIVLPDGKIAATVGGISPEENVAQALAIVQEL